MLKIVTSDQTLVAENLSNLSPFSRRTKLDNFQLINVYNTAAIVRGCSNDMPHYSSGNDERNMVIFGPPLSVLP